MLLFLADFLLRAPYYFWGSKNKPNIYNTGSAILIGSFAVPIIMSLLTFDGWEKMWAIAFCVPILSQCLSIFGLYKFITEYSGGTPDELIFGWSLVLYLVGSIAYYFISSSSSKGKMTGEKSKHRGSLKLAMLYLERVKGI